MRFPPSVNAHTVPTDAHAHLGTLVCWRTDGSGRAVFCPPVTPTAPGRMETLLPLSAHSAPPVTVTVPSAEFIHAAALLGLLCAVFVVSAGAHLGATALWYGLKWVKSRYPAGVWNHNTGGSCVRGVPECPLRPGIGLICEHECLCKRSGRVVSGLPAKQAPHV